MKNHPWSELEILVQNGWSADGLIGHRPGQRARQLNGTSCGELEQADACTDATPAA